MTVRARPCKAHFAPTETRITDQKKDLVGEVLNGIESATSKPKVGARNKLGRRTVPAAEGKESSWQFTSVVVRIGMNSSLMAGAFPDPQRLASGKPPPTLNLLIASSWRRARSV